MNSSLRIFLDMDEMLIHTGCFKPNKSLESIKLSFGMVSVLRPGAREFVDAMMKMAPTWLCTAGDKRYAMEVVNGFGLSRFFSGFIFREDLEAGTMFIHGGDRVVLVDDQPMWSPNTMAKARAIDADFGSDDVFVNVPSFYGSPYDSSMFGLAKTVTIEAGISVVT